MLSVGDFKPALLKGCLDQHLPRCSRKVPREGEAPPALPQQHGRPGTGQVQHRPVPDISLLPETGTQGVLEGQGGYDRLGPSAPWLSHLSSGTAWVCRGSRLPGAAARAVTSLLSWNTVVDEGATICCSLLGLVQPAQGAAFH